MSTPTHDCVSEMHKLERRVAELEQTVRELARKIEAREAADGYAASVFAGGAKQDHGGDAL